MNRLTITELPPPALRTANGVQMFWKAKMNGHFEDPTAEVTVTLPRIGPNEYLKATAKAALALQESMGSQRFMFTDG